MVRLIEHLEKNGLINHSMFQFKDGAIDSQNSMFGKLSTTSFNSKDGAIVVINPENGGKEKYVSIPRWCD